MATTRWLGRAAAVAQVTRYLFGGTWEADDIVDLTIGLKTVSVTAGSTTITTVVDNVASAWNALTSSVYPEYAEVTASRSGNYLVLTGDTAGVPFACTVSTRDAGGAADSQTIDGATSSAGVDLTACSGPHFWSVASNWSGGAVPSTGDVVYLAHSEVSIKYGLAQSAVTLAALHIEASYTGDVGLPTVNSDGAAYPEYRATYLAIGATALNVGAGEGQGSQRVKIDTGSAQTTVLVRQTGSPAEQDLPAMIWKGTHASNAVEVARGSFGAAVFGGESATVDVLRVGFIGSENADAQAFGGSGLTLTTLRQQGGQVSLNAGLTTVSQTGGRLTIGAGNVTTLTNDAGDVSYNGAGTIATLNVSGVFDASGDMRGMTVTNANLYAGASVRDPAGRVAWTNPIQLVRCGIPQVSLDVGVHRTLAVA